MKAPSRLYLNSDRTKLVAEDDPDAATLFATEGDDISDEDAKKYGVTAAKETKAEAAAPEDKAEDGPAEDKSEPSPRAPRARG